MIAIPVQTDTKSRVFRDFTSILNCFPNVVLPPGVVMEISLGPIVASESMVTFTSNCVGLVLEKLTTSIPSPKLTEVAPSRLLPFMVMLSVAP